MRCFLSLPPVLIAVAGILQLLVASADYNDYVPQEELFWHETGQCLAEYNRELQEGYLRVHGEPPPKPTV